MNINKQRLVREALNSNFATDDLALRLKYCVPYKDGWRLWDLLSQPKAQRFNRRLERRWETQRLLDEHTQEDGLVYVEVSGYDCDMTYGVMMDHCKPHWMDYNRLVDEILDGAEGPTYISILSTEEIEAFKPKTVDLALRAFEDGHPHCVFLGEV